MRHNYRVISVLLENESGALSRVVGLFSQRGYNIESLSVAPTHDDTLSRLTVSTIGSEHTIGQIIKHLNRLVEVVKVSDISDTDHMERELLLIKVRAVGSEQRSEIKRTVDIFRAQIVDTHPTLYTIQITGPSDKIASFLHALNDISILEYVSSGIIGMSRGDQILSTT